MAALPPIQDQPTEPIVPVSNRNVYRPYTFQVIAPRSNDRDREAVALEATMQSLVLDDKHPIALEITGEAKQKRFLVRTESEAACEHAKAHIRVRYPQADIRPLKLVEDPFTLRPQECVSVVELKPGAPSYLPMRTIEQRSIEQRGADPILGVLASLSLPEDERAICQITLVPAPASWSKGSLRKAVEHPLESERIQRQEALAAAGAGGPSTTGVVMLVIVFLLLLLYSRFKDVIPGWVYMAMGDIFLHGTWPVLTGAQQSLLLVGGIGLFFGLAVFFISVDQIRRRFFTKPLYDQRLVAQQTGKMAYRIRLRLYVIGPSSPQSLKRVRWALVWYEYVFAWWQLWCVALWCLTPLRWVGLLIWQNGKYFFLSVRFACTLPRWRIRWASWKRSWAYWKRNWSRHAPQWRPLLPPRPIPPGVNWQQWKHLGEEEQKQRKRREEALMSLAAAYRQFDTASAGHFDPKPLPDWRATLLICPSANPILARWSGWPCDVTKSAHYVSGDFLGMAWRLPQSIELADLPLIEQKRSRTLLIPSCLIAPAGVLPIGFSEHGGYTFPFTLTPDFFTAHTLIGGKSGEGKSTLMEHIAYLAMLGGGSLCLLDPHGDLARDVLRLVPPHRFNDVVYLDLGDKDYSVGFNPLDVKLGQDRDLMVSSIVSTFSHIWDTGWGTRMEAPFRAALMTLYEANEALCRRDPINGPGQQYTLLDIVPVLTDESFCHDLLVDVQDTYVHRFWHTYYDPLDLRQQRERIDPIVTKMAQFETKIARRIIGQSHSTINMSKLVAQNKILIVRLASGEAGTQTSPLVGATLLGLLMMALREQSVLAQNVRARMSIIVDEFQSIPGADYAVLMAELRKYGAAAVLATQSFEYLNKLNQYLLPTVLANVKQYFLFRMSAEDARVIARELDVAEADIVNIDSHTCYVKMTYQNRQQPTFSLHLQLPVLLDMSQAIAIRDQCRQWYTRRAADVEQQLVAAMARTVSASLHHKAKEEEDAKQQGPLVIDADDDDTEKRKAVKKPTSTAGGASSLPTATQSGTTPSSTQATGTTNGAAPTQSKDAGGGGNAQRPHVQFTPKKKREDLVSSFDVHPLNEQKDTQA